MDRNIKVWLPLPCPLLGTWPATQACTLTGNQTGNPLVHRLALNPLSHTSKGLLLSYMNYLYVFILTICLTVSQVLLESWTGKSLQVHFVVLGIFSIYPKPKPSFKAIKFKPITISLSSRDLFLCTGRALHIFIDLILKTTYEFGIIIIQILGRIIKAQRCLTTFLVSKARK